MYRRCEKGAKKGCAKRVQNTITFPVKCYNYSYSFEKVEIKEIDGVQHIWSNTFDSERRYDAFDNPELISELIALGNKKKEGKDEKKLAIEWVQKWGFLRAKKESDSARSQDLKQFWIDVDHFCLLWKIYKYITTKDFKVLEAAFKPVTKYDYLIDFSEDPLTNYQYNAMILIKKGVDAYIKNGELQMGGIQKEEYSAEYDRFKVAPSYFFKSLIDSIYMQFFLALSENKRVCQVCDMPFTAKRKDKIYCSDSCKNTAKSRVFRRNFKAKHGINYWEKDNIT